MRELAKILKEDSNLALTINTNITLQKENRRLKQQLINARVRLNDLQEKIKTLQFDADLVNYELNRKQ